MGSGLARDNGPETNRRGALLGGQAGVAGIGRAYRLTTCSSSRTSRRAPSCGTTGVPSWAVDFRRVDAPFREGLEGSGAPTVKGAASEVFGSSSGGKAKEHGARQREPEQVPDDVGGRKR